MRNKMSHKIVTTVALLMGLMAAELHAQSQEIYPPIEFNETTTARQAIVREARQEVSQFQGWGGWEAPKLLLQVNQRDQISNLQVIDSTLYYVGPGNKVYRLSPAANTSAVTTKAFALKYHGVHQIFATTGGTVWEALDAQLQANTVFAGQPWYEDCFTASNLGDSLITLSLGKDELSIAERRNRNWSLKQISGQGMPAKYVFPRVATTEVWDGVRFLGLQSGIDYMAIMFYLDKWYIQAFDNRPPTTNGSVGGKIGPKIAIFNDGQEMGLFYRNGGKNNELVMIYTDDMLLLGINRWITWPNERFSFKKEVRGVAQNSKIAAVAVNDGSAGNVYVFPYERLRRNLHKAFNGPTPYADTLKIPIINPLYFDITGLVIAPNNDVYVSVDFVNQSGPGAYGQIWLFKNRSVATEVAERQSEVPASPELSQNYPNPFNPTTMIGYALPQAGRVTLKIYDVTGREVATLVNAEMPAGLHKVSWNGRNTDGAPMPSGVYLYRLEIAGAFVQTKKLTLMR